MALERFFEPLSEVTGYTYDLEVLERGESAYQRYEVGVSPLFGRMFRLDGAAMTSEGDEFIYHENLVHVPALAHREPRVALVIGGGDGGSAEELLKHPSIVRVDLVELDGEVLALARRYFASIHRGSLEDLRVSVRVEDGLKFVGDRVARGERGIYDLILLDLTDPVGPAAQLYEEPFFRACAQLLNEEGLLSLHLGAPDHRPERVRALVARLRAVFRFVFPHFHYIPLYGAQWGMAAASNATNCSALTAEEIDARLAARGIGDLRYLDGTVYQARAVLPRYLRAVVG
ncbi:MAG: polyamine aminopropyltransferase [Hydrogenophilus sp.]|nr:polyamine aminopropyltransferase [Hydrogenophilus sp.]